MADTIGTSGLIFKEALLWEKSREGRCAVSIPTRDVPTADLAPELVGAAPELPQLSEFDVVRHYTRLSQWNFGLDSGMYPLGSCTMKYNPRINDVQAARPGFAGAHPMIDDELSQGGTGAVVPHGAIPGRDHRHGRHHPAAGGRSPWGTHRHAGDPCLSRKKGTSAFQNHYS